MSCENEKIETVNNDIIVVENNDCTETEQKPFIVKHPDFPDIKSFLKAIYDPTDISQKTGKIQWFFFPLLPALCYGLFALHLFIENNGTGIPAGNFLIVPIGALCGYAFTLLSCIIMFVLFKIMKYKFSFKTWVAALSGSFVGATLIGIIMIVLNIFIKIPTSFALGIFIFMIPLSIFTVKNCKGKTLPTICLSLISIFNIVILCLMIKVGGIS